MTLNNNYALVTGASQGLGREIARELASLGYNLLLTALPDETNYAKLSITCFMERKRLCKVSL